MPLKTSTRSITTEWLEIKSALKAQDVSSEEMQKRYDQFKSDCKVSYKPGHDLS